MPITKRRSEQGKKQGLQATEKEFIFRGLITCAVTGKRASPYTGTNRRKQKYNYLATWDPNDPTHQHKISIPARKRGVPKGR
jgi:hypothetical protein